MTALHPTTTAPWTADHAGSSASSATPGLAPASAAPLQVRDATLTWPDGQDDDGSPRAVHALDHVNLEAAAGVVTAVVGPSGSGKSSLLSVVAGLVSPSGGQVLVAGRDVARMSTEERAQLRRNQVGMVFQSPNLIPSLTAREQLLLRAHIDGSTRVRRRAAAERADELLELLGLREAAGRRAHQLSGGQQQRVNIGRALMSRPTIMLVDEPTAALDHERSLAVMDLLRRTTRRFETATVLVTHDTALLQEQDRRVAMSDGRIIENSA